MKTIDSYLAHFGIQNPYDFFSKDEISYIKQTLLLDIEKQNSSNLDRWGNFDETILVETNRPFLDQFIIERLEQNGIEFAPIWPDNKSFAVCLTHDVDRVESYSPKVFKRNISKRFRYSNSNKERVKLAIQYFKNSIKQIYFNKKFDPIWNYERWEDVENKYNVKSTYFFFVRTNSKDIQPFDCDFDLCDSFQFRNELITVKNYIKYLHESEFEIGLHGSFKSALNSDVFLQQKKKIEQIISMPVVSTRQHYLHYANEITQEVHVKNGIIIDSTLGLNKSTGFRVGTAFPYIIETKHGDYWELPLIIMDSSILGNQNLSFNDAKKEVMKIIDYVEKVGGCLTINFHLDYVNDTAYFDLYQFILETTISKNAYFGTCQQIINSVKNVRNSRNLV